MALTFNLRKRPTRRCVSSNPRITAIIQQNVLYFLTKKRKLTTTGVMIYVQPVKF